MPFAMAFAFLAFFTVKTLSRTGVDEPNGHEHDDGRHANSINAMAFALVFASFAVFAFQNTPFKSRNRRAEWQRAL
jgi:hypothetical protein